MKLRIRELDALRGFAAMAVVIVHFTIRHPMPANWFLNIGCMGVDLFFIISGFVIFMSIEKSKTWRVFLWNRFARLYPAYWVCVSLTSVAVFLRYKFLVPTLSSYFILKYIGNMTMFQYYFHILNIDWSYWTLVIEWLFYITMMLLMVTNTLKYIIPIGFTLVLVCSGYAFQPIFNDPVCQKILWAVPLLKYFPLFFAGIMVYKMRFEKITPVRLFIFSCTYIIQCMLFENCHDNHHSIGIYQYAPVLALIYTTVVLFLYDKLSLILNPVTIWLGQISYSLYLVHQFIGADLLMPVCMVYLKLSFWPSAVIALLLILGLATLIYKYVEVPTLSYLRAHSPVKRPVDDLVVEV